MVCLEVIVVVVVAEPAAVVEQAEVVDVPVDRRSAAIAASSEPFVAALVVAIVVLIAAPIVAWRRTLVVATARSGHIDSLHTARRTPSLACRNCPARPFARSKDTSSVRFEGYTMACRMEVMERIDWVQHNSTDLASPPSAVAEKRPRSLN